MSPDPSCRWQLRPLQIVRLPESFAVGADGLTLGRSDGADVQIPEAGFPYVSSLHARISLDGRDAVVEDLGSRNGTLVNGESVTRRVLHNGDVLQLGNMGPRFAVVCSDGMRDTLPGVPLPAGAGDSGRDSAVLSATRIGRIKDALGIPHDKDLDAASEEAS